MQIAQVTARIGETVVDVALVAIGERYAIGSAPTARLAIAGVTEFPLVVGEPHGFVVRRPVGLGTFAVEPPTAPFGPAGELVLGDATRATLVLGLLEITIERVDRLPVPVLPRPPFDPRVPAYLLATLLAHLLLWTAAITGGASPPATKPRPRPRLRPLVAHLAPHRSLPPAVRPPVSARSASLPPPAISAAPPPPVIPATHPPPVIPAVPLPPAIPAALSPPVISAALPLPAPPASLPPPAPPASLPPPAIPAAHPPPAISAVLPGAHPTRPRPTPGGDPASPLARGLDDPASASAGIAAFLAVTKDGYIGTMLDRSGTLYRPGAVDPSFGAAPRFDPPRAGAIELHTGRFRTLDVHDPIPPSQGLALCESRRCEITGGLVAADLRSVALTRGFELERCVKRGASMLELDIAADGQVTRIHGEGAAARCAAAVIAALAFPAAREATHATFTIGYP